MNIQQCPLCATEMNLIDVAPCYDCGHADDEITAWKNQEHSYSKYRAFDAAEIVLCDFCDVDFGSYHPEYFGLPHTGKVLGTDCLEPLGEMVNTAIGKDQYCPQCKHRLAFIKFRMKAIAINKAAQQDAPGDAFGAPEL